MKRRMCESDEYVPTFAEPITHWISWFAWRPVETVDRGWMWLRIVNRRRCQPHDYLSGSHAWYWQYVKQPKLMQDKAEQ